MRICLYTDTSLPKLGGQEMVVDALARQFHALGHDVVVLAPQPRLPLRANDASLPYKVVRHPRFYSTRYFVDWYRWWLLRLYRSQRFDVLHCHGLYPPGYLAALSRPCLPVPVVITSHGGDVFSGNRRLARPVLRQRHVQALASADALVAISRFTEDAYRLLCPQARQVVTIPNGVHLETFAARTARPEGLVPGIQAGNYVLFLGRLKRRKGVDVLLEAVHHLSAQGDVQLVVAGQGEEQLALEAQAERLGLTNRVHFAGRVHGEAKMYLLQNALCMVVPSRLWESFGLVVLESYAAGVPVIATRMPGLEDLVEPGQTGFPVAAESPTELAQALRETLGDRSRTRLMGERHETGARLRLAGHRPKASEFVSGIDQCARKQTCLLIGSLEGQTMGTGTSKTRSQSPLFLRAKQWGQVPRRLGASPHCS